MSTPKPAQAAPKPLDNVCIPIHLDAFAISPGSCEGESSLGPYTQPNYTSLQLDSHLIQHDVLPHMDFHLASPSSRNPRVANLGASPGDTFPWRNLKRNRLGVNLSWALPRLYRTAQASGKSAATADKSKPAPNVNPQFRPFPNRWLITRRLINFQDQNKLPQWQSWVVESDVIRDMKDIGDDVDLESDVAPFVTYSASDSGSLNLLRAQTEKFLGQKFDYAGTQPWKEDGSRKRIPGLTLMHSANPLFADNALHNGNVLSMIDNFAYPDSKVPSGIGYLDRAVCDYYVIGWHQDAKDDPLHQAEKIDLVTRLSKLLLKVDDKYQDNQDVVSNPNSTRCLVHGAIYGVTYDFLYDPTKPSTDPKRPSIRSLANEAAHKFTDQVKMEPLSVGTTPLDAVLTFLDAHQGNADDIFGAGAKDLAGSIMNIAQLLYATGDDYDSRVQAQDLVAQQNFTKDDGGNQWIFAQTTDPGKPAATLNDQDDIDDLNALNDAQFKYDATQRKLASLRWALFAEWWKYVTKYIFAKDQKATDKDVSTVVTGIKNAITDLESKRDAFQKTLDSKRDLAKFRAVTLDAYHTKIDPTLCVAGLDSGWPTDWADTLQIRLARDISTDDTVAKDILDANKNSLTGDSQLDKLVRRLLQECSNNSKTPNGTQGLPKVTGFVSWANKNPFVPIYIEWEGVYYHVGPLGDKWEVKLRPSPVGHAHQQVRYVPKGVLSRDDDNHKDFRTVSGRVLVLPQPVFSLEVLVNSVLDTASNDITLSADQQKTLRANIRQMQFISAPLSGLTNHLLTRFEGAHVKPSAREQGQRVPTALTAAVRTTIGMDEAAIRQIDGESALTPYGDSFAFGVDQYPNPPFKPATHGQLILTKVNIIDKFGQAVCLPKIQRPPRLPPDLPTSNIFPCLSDWLSPDAIDSPGIKGKIMNTVLPTPDPVQPGQWPLCQYIQLTPGINQNARINGSFLVRGAEDAKVKNTFKPWQEATDYDPMIWGWVIINYADNGLQFFTGDGIFFREIRKGGVAGTTVVAEWNPPDPLQKVTDAADITNRNQLAQLVEQVRKPQYFQKFVDTINGSIQNMSFPPSDYSAYANSIVGKPLALVNVGWSLELSQPAFESQNTLGKPHPDAEKFLSSLNFPIKLGDISRTYDGVVGYWLTDNNTPTCDTNWNKMYTYFAINWDNLPAGQVLQLPPTSANPNPTYTVVTGDTLASISTSLKISIALIKARNPGIADASPNDTFIPIAESNFPNLSPYYIHPDKLPANQTYLAAKAAQYKLVTSLLIDPYTSIHAYSPILPTKRLTLPAYTIQRAFENMHAFFHLGPLLQTNDVPPTKTLAVGQTIQLPVSGRKGTWKWMQPYDRILDDPTDDAKNDLQPRYVEMEVQEDLMDRKFEKGPFTFVEGLLQLTGSLGAKKMAQDAVNAGGGAPAAVAGGAAAGAQRR